MYEDIHSHAYPRPTPEATSARRVKYTAAAREEYPGSSGTMGYFVDDEIRAGIIEGKGLYEGKVTFCEAGGLPTSFVHEYLSTNRLYVFLEGID